MMLIVFLLLTVLACQSDKLIVTKIKQGAQLAHAQETSVNDFFQKRLNNKIRKAKIGAWHILYENDVWIYFGYPKFGGLLDDAQYIDTLYRVKKEELSLKLPSYQRFEGYLLRQTIENAGKQWLISKLITTPHQLDTLKARLEPPFIWVNAVFKANTSHQVRASIPLQMQIDVASLRVIEIASGA